MKSRSLVLIVMLSLLLIAARDYNDGDAGEGFRYRSVSFQNSSADYVKVTGEMINRSGTDYETAMFDLTVYDSRKDVIGVGSISITNFRNGSTRPLSTMLKGDADKIAGFKIDYSLGIEK